MLESEITESLIHTLVNNIVDPMHWDRVMRLIELGVVTRDDLRDMIQNKTAGQNTAANPLYAPIP